MRKIEFRFRGEGHWYSELGSGLGCKFSMTPPPPFKMEQLLEVAYVVTF